MWPQVALPLGGLNIMISGLWKAFPPPMWIWTLGGDDIFSGSNWIDFLCTPVDLGIGLYGGEWSMWGCVRFSLCLFSLATWTLIRGSWQRDMTGYFPLSAHILTGYALCEVWTCVHRRGHWAWISRVDDTGYVIWDDASTSTVKREL